MRAATGGAILLLNPDTELLPGALDVLWQALHVSRHVGLVAPLLLNSDRSVQSAGYRFPGIANVAFDVFPLHPRLVASPLNGRMPVSDGHQPVKIDYALGAALLVKREVIDDVGEMDESYGMYSEEIDWAKRMAQRGWTALLAPQARVIHHGGQSTRQRPEAMHLALWESRARYHARYATPRQRRVIRWLVECGTRWQDRAATAERRETNARIRAAFRRGGG
jgi:GT2 family glycosyltransferase